MNEQKLWNNYWGNRKKMTLKKDPLYKDAISILPRNKKFFILEAGCGDGKWLFHFNKMGYKNVVGLDFSETGLKKIRKTDKTTMLINGDIRNLPIKDNVFDTVFSFGVIEHFEKSQVLVDEMYRTMKKNGLLFLDTPNLLSLHTFYRFYRRLRGKWVVGYEVSYTPRQLEKILMRAGFKILRKGTRGKYNKLDVFGFLGFVVGRK